MKGFCTYELSKQLKEKGFNERCHQTLDNPSTKIFYPDPVNENDCAQCGKSKELHHQYDGKPFFCEKDRRVNAPTYHQAVNWFREKHKIEIYIIPFQTPTKTAYEYHVRNFSTELHITIQAEYTPELAYQKAIEEALKLI